MKECQNDTTIPDEATEYHFSPEAIQGSRINEDGQLCVKNLSAYWIPQLTITEEISGTRYTVTGSFEGSGSLLHKLERITAKKFTEKSEDAQ